MAFGFMCHEASAYQGVQTPKKDLKKKKKSLVLMPILDAGEFSTEGDQQYSWNAGEC